MMPCMHCVGRTAASVSQKISLTNKAYGVCTSGRGTMWFGSVPVGYEL